MERTQSQIDRRTFFSPSEKWATSYLENTAGFVSKETTDFIRRDVCKRLFSMLIELSYELRRKNVARYRITNEKTWEPYPAQLFLDKMPNLKHSNYCRELLEGLAKELHTWLKNLGGRASLLPEGLPVDSLVLEKHGIDMILQAPVLTLEAS